ncbi:MAG TPA: preprotein translocase subunit SecG [Rudaea sp.]|jgi:preprotein translocase subunit SecG
MLLTIFNVIYVLVALGMIILILLQRGAGAAAGSGFGGGASGTVFGARGATTFLSRSTAVLAGLFFLLSLGMGAFLGNPGVNKQADDLGIMSGVETPAPKAPAAPAAGGDVPTPAAGAAATGGGDKPAAVPAPAAPTPATPAKGSDSKGKPAEPEKH